MRKGFIVISWGTRVRWRNGMENASPGKEPSARSRRHVGDVLPQHALPFVVSEFLAFRHPRKITAAFIECFLLAKAFLHII